ncbi:RidA family protein [Streptomyces sp. NPDC058579]|uniref:RidA family protein n=1 Tax=Streptomyces sp. NPDC058579 TaxID=3346548 RepID=UPI003666BF2F
MTTGTTTTPATDQRTITNPGTLHDPSPFGYSHAVSAPGELVFIGGQYASDATGAPVPGDFAAQVELAFTNLRLALEGAGLGFEHVVRLGSYIVDHDLAKLEVLGKALHGAFGDRLPAQTLSGVAALALPGMLFEIDAVAVRPTS